MTPGETVGVLVGLVAVAAAAVKAGRWALRALRRHLAHRRAIAAAQVAFLSDWNGDPGDELRRIPPRHGVLQRLNETEATLAEVRHRQEEIAVVAQSAADDVSAVRSELTRNGGSSTKDVVAQAAQSSEAAAAAAELANKSAHRTEALLRKHVANGEDIMEVGVHNDQRLFESLERHGITVDGLRDYPEVYLGDDE